MPAKGDRHRPPVTPDIIEVAAVIDLSLTALTKAWIATVIASGLLFTALATAQIWDRAVYLRSLPQAFQLISDGPPPIIDRWN